MKKLIINPESGCAGDMFSAALISAGADEKQVIGAMREAGRLLGSLEIKAEHEKQGSITGIYLRITGKLNDRGIDTVKAKKLLEEICSQYNIKAAYKDFALRALSILAQAEEKAHREIDAGSNYHTGHTHQHAGHTHQHVTHQHAGDYHQHDHVEQQTFNYHTNASDDSHHNVHQHKHAADSETVSPILHEAQDIVIDLVGASYALQLLNMDIYNVLCLEPVFIGSGVIRFSHGEFPVPAPATKAIINDFHIPAMSGPAAKELLTPTGAAIIAALATSYCSRQDFMKKTDIQKMITGIGFGTTRIENGEHKPNALYLYLAE